MSVFQINRNHVEPEFSTLSRTIPEFISDGVLIPNPKWQGLAIAWTEFRRLEKLGSTQSAIGQGMTVKILLDALAGWTEWTDEPEDDQLAEVDRLQEDLQARYDEEELG